MIDKTSEELIAEFPFLKATDENPWCYGNCEGDNWFYECPEGWQNVFYDLLYAIKPILEICGGTLQIHQVKEKFGGLRFYYELSNCNDKATQEIRNLVNYAEDLSYKICLHCGKEKEIEYHGNKDIIDSGFEFVFNVSNNLIDMSTSFK